MTTLRRRPARLRRRHPGHLQRDGARAGARLRDGRRRARRALVGAHHPRPRGRERVRLRGPERERPDRRGELLRRRVADRVHVQLVLRGRQGRRDVLERAAAGASPARGHRTADDRQRPLRVARLPGRRQAPARHDAGRRHDRQLEQQAGRRLGGRGRHLELRLRAPQRPARADGRPARDALAGVDRRRDEQGGHAGPAGGEGDPWRAVGPRDRPRAEPARPADGRAAPGLADAGIAPPRPGQQRHDRPPGRGHPRQGMVEDRGRGHGPGARSPAR